MNLMHKKFLNIFRFDDTEMQNCIIGPKNQKKLNGLQLIDKLKHHAFVIKFRAGDS